MTVRVINVEDTTAVDMQSSKKGAWMGNRKATLYREMGYLSPWLVEEGLKVRAATVWMGRDGARLGLEVFWRGGNSRSGVRTFGRRFKLP